MKFSRKTTYGLRAMIHLAKNFNKRNVSLFEISKSEEISKKYLEQIFIKLKKSELVGAEKGKKGGYFLLKKPSEISVLEIVGALEGGVSSAECVSANKNFVCKKGSVCGVIGLLCEVQAETVKILKKRTLQDLAKEHK